MLGRGGDAALAEVRAVASRVRGLNDEVANAFATVDELGGAGTRLVASGRRRVVPELERALERLATAADRLESLARRLERQPQSVLFGPESAPPGPGEPGFERPEADAP